MRNIIAAALTVAATSAFGGTIANVTMPTNRIGSAVTETLADTMGVDGQTNVWTLISFKMSAASTSNQVVKYRQGFAGVWASTNSITIAANGTTTVDTLTSSTVTHPQFQLLSWENTETNGTVATNLVVKYWKE